jgi:hypothetical protein
MSDLELKTQADVELDELLLSIGVEPERDPDLEKLLAELDGTPVPPVKQLPKVPPKTNPPIPGKGVTPPVKAAPLPANLGNHHFLSSFESIEANLSDTDLL